MPKLSSLISDRIFFKLCRYVLFFVIAAASVHGFFSQYHFTDINEDGSIHGKNNFASILEGTADRPYVYRQLLPMTANWLDSHTPAKLKDRLYNQKDNQGKFYRERLFDSPLARTQSYFLRYWLMFTFVFASAYISLHALFEVGKSIGLPPLVAAFSSLIVLLCIPFFMQPAGYYYDYPELAFVALGALVAVRYHWFWLIPVTALATWNKESYLFYVLLLFPLLRIRLARGKALLATTLAAATSVAVQTVIRHIYANNHGGAVEIHLRQQFASFLGLYNPLHLNNAYGLLLPFTENVLLILLIIGIARFGLLSLSLNVRQHIYWTALVDFLLYLFLGSPYELRAMGFLYLTLMILIGSVTCRYAQLEFRCAGSPAYQSEHLKRRTPEPSLL